MTDELSEEFKELLGQLEEQTEAVELKAINKLSIRNNVFSKVVPGVQAEEIESGVVQAVIVKSGDLSRLYYSQQYVEGGKNPPTCWSEDTHTGRPSNKILPEDIQSKACFDCKQNIRGSGVGGGRACRFQQRIAILLADATGQVTSEQIYQLTLPATSIFGGDKQKMSLQAYAKFLNAHEKPVPFATLLTEIKFDADNKTPKLLFKPLRVLEEAELNMATKIQRADSTKEFIKLYIHHNTPPHEDLYETESVFATVTEEGAYIHKN